MENEGVHVTEMMAVDIPLQIDLWSKPEVMR